MAGGVLTIAYGHNETTLTDKLGNVQVLQFNTWGNTVSIQDGEGRAQFAQYARDTDSSGKGNQLQLASKLQNTVRNLFSDNSFEDGTTWTNGSSTATVNSQPWYFTHEEQTVHLWCSEKGSRLDAGIALAHLYVSGAEAFRFFHAEPAAQLPGYRYIGSVNL